MRYFYNVDTDEYLTLDDVKAEYVNDINAGIIDTESFEEFEDYLYFGLEHWMHEISEDVYNEADKADAVKQAIARHAALDPGSWAVEISADGEAWLLTLYGDPVCCIEIDDVIPALDYINSNADDITTALWHVINTWGIGYKED